MYYRLLRGAKKKKKTIHRIPNGGQIKSSKETFMEIWPHSNPKENKITIRLGFPSFTNFFFYIILLLNINKRFYFHGITKTKLL